MKAIKLCIALAVMLVMASCASKKHITDNPTVNVNTTTTTPTVDNAAAAEAAAAKARLNFVDKVAKNAVNTENVTAKIEFNLQTGSKDITVNGKLLMRRDDVIRIQLQVPLLGMEAGRLEFTKDYVMIVDRIHTEYIKGDYNQVDFLRNNGINFNSLQALFWNQLFMPGEDKLTTPMMKQYEVTLNDDPNNSLIALLRDNMSYLWEAGNKDGLIRQTTVEYKNQKSGNTKLTCTYDDFRELQGKQFPASINLNMNTAATKKARQIKIGIKAKSLGSDSNWDTRTTLSKKYKAVSVDEVMKKITSL